MRCICREGRGIDIWTKSWRMKKNLVYVMNLTICLLLWDFPGGLTIRNPPANAGDKVLIPGLERCPGEGNSNPLQYSCLGNAMDRGAWQSTVMGSQKSQTWLGDWVHTHTHTHTHKARMGFPPTLLICLKQSKDGCKSSFTPWSLLPSQQWAGFNLSNMVKMVPCQFCNWTCSFCLDL